MLIIREIDPINVPLPDPGKAIVFLDSTDGIYKIKKNSGAIVPLEGLSGAVNAEDVQYDTNDITYWGWADAVPTDAEVALDALAEEVKRINGILDIIAPAKAGDISNLVISLTTLYQGKVAAGLAAEWYDSVSAGDTINNLVYDNTFRLSANEFTCGEQNTPSSYGQLDGLVGGVVINTHDMTAGAGTTGIVTVDTISVFNGLWAAADGRIDITQTTEGYEYYNLEHTEAGLSNNFGVHYDDTATLPTFTAPLTVVENTKVSKWLSGNEYYGFGSTFDVSYTVQDLFTKVYTVSGVTVISCTGMNNLNVDPVGIPTFSDDFIVASELVTLDKNDECSLNPSMTTVATKPNNANAASSGYNILVNLGLPISTFGVVSTAVNELMQDEDKRFYRGTTTPFNSSAVLPMDEAEMVCGELGYGSHSLVEQYFERRFTKSVANSGTILFTGINYTDIDPFGTGDLNVLLWLEDEDFYYDLGRAFGDDNGTGDKSTPANSKGARVTGAAGSVDFSFGTDSTANNSNQYRIIVIFKNASHSINSIQTS